MWCHKGYRLQHLPRSLTTCGSGARVLQLEGQLPVPGQSGNEPGAAPVSCCLGACWERADARPKSPGGIVLTGSQRPGLLRRGVFCLCQDFAGLKMPVRNPDSASSSLQVTEQEAASRGCGSPHHQGVFGASGRGCLPGGPSSPCLRRTFHLEAGYTELRRTDRGGFSDKPWSVLQMQTEANRMRLPIQGPRL